MALVEFYKPRSLSAKRLDGFLAAGWFRSGNGLFRNKVLCLEGKLCQVMNIRLRTSDFEPGKSLRKILRRSGHLRMEVGPLELSHDMESLYQHTRLRFKGFIFPNLQTFLYDFNNRSVFKSWNIKLYEDNKLVAASIFDVGRDTLMSVLGMYHPSVKHLSPGILTMIHEVLWAREQGKTFYYPGYVLCESRSFDYKLQLGGYEYLSEKNRWTKKRERMLRVSPLTDIELYSNHIREELERRHIPHQKLLYKLFSLGYAYPAGTFLRQPVIFILPELSDNPFKISLCSWDQEQKQFKLCHPIPVQDNFLADNQSDEFRDHEVYYDMILQDSPEDSRYFDTAEDLCDTVLGLIHRRSIPASRWQQYSGKT